MALLIDSSVVVAAERGQLAAEDLRARFAGQSVAFAAITVSELLHGVHRADTSARRHARSQFVEVLLDQIPVVPFDVSIARVHAAIWADLEVW